MANPLVQARQTLTVDPITDTLHIRDMKGNIISWIDNTGTGQGNLANNLVVSNGLNIATAGLNHPTPYIADNTQGTNPYIYIQDVNGSWHPFAGIDFTTADAPFGGGTSGPIGPPGILTIVRNLYVRDTGSSTQQGKNALISVNHTSGTFTSAGNQDRAVWIQHYTPVGDTAARYGMETLQMELGINGAPTWTGSPDAEASVLSVQLNDAHTNNTPGPTNHGVNGIRVSYFRRPGAAIYGSTGSHGIRISMVNQSTLDANGLSLVGLQVTCQETTGGGTNIGYFGIHCKQPESGFFVNGHRAMSIDDHGSRASDFNFFSNGTATSGKMKTTGPLICTQSVRTDNAGNTDFAGQLTLSNGTAAYTFAATFVSVPIITLYNLTNPQAVPSVAITKTGFTITGSGTDVINYVVVGRN